MAELSREQALEEALKKIEKEFGKGSIMRLGDEIDHKIEVIPSGSIALDKALGVGGKNHRSLWSRVFR